MFEIIYWWLMFIILSGLLGCLFDDIRFKRKRRKYKEKVDKDKEEIITEIIDKNKKDTRNTTHFGYKAKKCMKPTMIGLHTTCGKVNYNYKEGKKNV